MRSEVEHQVSYIKSCQLPSGGFVLAPQDTRLNPYFTNLALPALLLCDEHESVKRYIDWFFTNLHPDGYINDFALTPGGKELDTGKRDSEDSYIATFFTLIRQYQELTGDTETLLPRTDALKVMLSALLSLQQKDGLTWAKSSYRVKYLMDNCEVWKGLYDASALFSTLGEAESARLAAEGAIRCKQGILGKWSRLRQSFACYDYTYPRWNKWYPDATSQAFPVVFGVLSPLDRESQVLYDKLITHFPHFSAFQTGDMYPWMVIGRFAALMGDEKRVQQMLSMAEELYIFGPRHPYWLLHEAGFYIQLVKKP